MPKHSLCPSLMRGVYKGKDAEGLQGITVHFTESGKDGAALRRFPSILKRRAWVAASFHRFFVPSSSSSISIEASSSIRACVCSTASSGRIPSTPQAAVWPNALFQLPSFSDEGSRCGALQGR